MNIHEGNFQMGYGPSHEETCFQGYSPSKRLQRLDRILEFCMMQV